MNLPLPLLLLLLLLLLVHRSVFRWKNPDFLLKNPDFLLKSLDFITKQGASGQPRRTIIDVEIDGIRTEINEAGDRSTTYDLEIVEHGFNRQQPFKVSRTADDWLDLVKQIKGVAMANCQSEDPEVELRDLLSWLQVRDNGMELPLKMMISY